MAIEELLGALRGGAEARAAEELGAAHAEAARIVEQSMTGLAAKRTARLRMIEAEIRAETDAALALERRRVRNEVLSARHAMLERVFTAVTAAIPGALLGEGSSNLVRHLTRLWSTCRMAAPACAVVSSSRRS
jgi:vacuolar-type H+-ATPase subunit E/Vma4